MTKPVHEIPGTWPCCKCDGLRGDECATLLTWSGKITVVCPKCGHLMTWNCCGKQE